MPDPAAPDPRRWRALAVCVTALALTLLDFSTVNVALPSIGRGTGAGPSQLQWMVSGYVLAFGMVPIIAGRLGDDRGRRTMLLIGIGGFVVSSAVVGLAGTAPILLGGRVIQGLAGGLINPQVSGLIQNLFPPAERGVAFGTLGSAIGIAQATGPTLGGLIIGLGGDQLGWRLTFLLNIPVGIVAFVLCRRWLPPAPLVRAPRPLDLPGVALLATGLFGVLFPVVEYDASHDARLAFVLIPAAALLTAFVWWERGPARRRGHALIDINLFKIRSFADGVGLAVCYFVAYSGLPLVLSLFLQDGLGFSPARSGLTAGAFALGTAIGAPVAGRLIPRLGRTLLVGSLLVFGAGVLAVAAAALLVGRTDPGPVAGLVLAGPLFLAGLGGGSVITPNQALSLADVDARGGSTAGGMLQTAQRVGSAAGSALTSAVFYAAARGAPGGGVGRVHDYAGAFATGLLVCLVFGTAALVVAVRGARRGRPMNASR